MKKRLSSVVIATALLTTLVSTQAAELSPQEAKKIAIDAYIYGYALMTSDVTEKAFTNTVAPSPETFQAPLNQFVSLLAREIIVRFVARNIAMLRQRRLPVTAGTVYLAHFAGGAGAVAILSAPDNFDAALVVVNADSTGRTKRERLIKANPFLEHFTVADLKSWAERKMRGPNLRLAEADTNP
jgi:hypothetical protein